MATSTKLTNKSKVSRQKLADSRDAELELSTGGDSNQVDVCGPDESRVRLEFSSAMHTLRILGQILRKYPGSLEAEIKLALTEACYDISLRSLTVAFNQMENGKRETQEAIINAICQMYPNFSAEKLKSKASQYLWLVTVLSTHGIIRAVSSAIAASELVPTYAKVLASRGSSAVKLIDTSLKLEVGT